MKFQTTQSVRQYILDTFDQADIYAHYLGISRSEIDWCLRNKHNKISNPLRTDHRPSLGFMGIMAKTSYKVIMKDFANSTYDGDCFHLVGLVLMKNCNIPKDFIYICDHIIKHVKHDGIEKVHISETYTVHNDSITTIKYSDREINRYDILYFKRYHIQAEDITKHYIPVFWAEVVTNDIIVENYMYDYKDPCYAYPLGVINGVAKVKLYFPNRRSGIKPRFRTNYSFSIEGLFTLKKAKNGILQKSLKDKICLNNILSDIEVEKDIFVLNVSSESVRLSKPEDNLLKSYYSTIYSMFDADQQGLACAEIFKRDYSIIPIYFKETIALTYPEILDENSGLLIPKNISDFIDIYSYEQAKQLILNLIKFQIY